MRTAFQDQGLDGHRFDLRITCAPVCLQPGSTVTVQLRTNVDLPLLPDSLGGNQPSFRLDSVQQVPYGTYLEGSHECGESELRDERGQMSVMIVGFGW